MANKTEKFVALVALYVEMGPRELSFFALVLYIFMQLAGKQRQGTSLSPPQLKCVLKDIGACACYSKILFCCDQPMHY